MKSKLEEVLTPEERLDLWVEMMALATAMQEYCDWWWLLDDGMRDANKRRGCYHDNRQMNLPYISD